MFALDKSIHVNMLGKFTIFGPGLPQPRVVSLSGRSRRLWILVAYLILNRERGVPAQELIDWLWPESEGITPMSTLQNNISRTRNALEELGLEDGKRLIYNNSGTYFWAPDRKTILDCEVFETLCRNALDGKSWPLAMEQGISAAKTYTGEFLPECAGESWRDTRWAHFRELYRKLLNKELPWLLDSARYEEAAAMCAQARTIEPENQSWAACQMRALRLSGKPEEAMAVYTSLHLENEAPSAELALEKEEAQRAQAGTDGDSRLLKALVGGEQTESGAMLCDNTVFREFVRRQLRDLRRGGEAQMLSFRLDEADPLKRAQAMDRMENTLRQSLRGGDPFTRGGNELFLLLLPGANRENGEMVANRILTCYNRDLPAGLAPFAYQVMDLNSEEA